MDIITSMIAGLTRQRNEARAALRAIIDAIDDEYTPAFQDTYYSTGESAMLVRARDVLRGESQS